MEIIEEVEKTIFVFFGSWSIISLTLKVDVVYYDAIPTGTIVELIAIAQGYICKLKIFNL